MLIELKRRFVEQGPSLLRYPLQLVPFSVQKPVIEQLLARIFKEAISEGDFAFLRDKWLKVEVTDLALTWFISEQQGRLVVASSAVRSDVCFSGSANDLVLIAGRKEDPDALFFQRKLKIEGDTELGLEVKNMMDNLELENLPSLLKYPLLDLAHFIDEVRNTPTPQTK